MKMLNDQELADAIERFKGAEASLACEGIYFEDEEKALFRSFEEQRLPHDECRRRIFEYCRTKRGAQHLAAE